MIDVMHALRQAAGFYEGSVTATQLEQFCYNSGFYTFIPAPPLATFLGANMAFMQAQINESLSLPYGHPLRIYWHHVRACACSVRPIIHLRIHLHVPQHNRVWLRSVVNNSCFFLPFL